jgi:hypothetical protein
MLRRFAALVLVTAAALAACGPAAPAAPSSASAPDPGAGSASEPPPMTGQPPAAEDARVTITTATGTAFTFDVESCTSPGSNVINLQASGPAGDLDLRASVQGRFSTNGSPAIEAEIDEVAVADDGSVAASGTLVIADAPDVRVPFELVATPGSCSRP